MATPLVPREYVRQQLKSMGINEISEQELESYTRGVDIWAFYLNSSLCFLCVCVADFSRLIQEHIDHDSTSSSDLSSLSDAAQPRPLSSCSVSSVEVTPLNTHHPPPPRSALFKVRGAVYTHTHTHSHTYTHTHHCRHFPGTRRTEYSCYPPQTPSYSLPLKIFQMQPQKI